MRRPGYKYLLALMDWLIASASFVAAVKLQTKARADLFYPVFPFLSPEMLFFLFYALVIVFIFYHNHLYKINVFLTLAAQTVRLLQSVFVAVLGLAVLSYFTKSAVIVESRLAIAYFVVFSLSLWMVMRVFLFRSLFLLLARNRIYRRRVVILGAGPTGRLVAATAQWKNPYGLHVLGFLDDEFPVGEVVFSGLKVVGKIKEAPTLVNQLQIDEVLVCLEDVSHQRLLDVLDLCQRTAVHVKIASPLYDVIAQRMFTERYGDIPIIAFGNGHPRSAHLLLKRIMDLALSTTGIVLFAPIFLVIGAAIKLDSRGPVIFRQVRVGKDGNLFHFYKFRSMVLGSDRDEDREYKAVSFVRGAFGHSSEETKIVNEAQVTRVGKFLRKTALDELPQLFNVVKGEMSLVGPRPCLPYEWQAYDSWQKQRLSAMPGCTGVWQVSGRSAVGFQDMVILDLYYIHNASLLFDLQLILKTIPVMLLGRGGK